MKLARLILLACLLPSCQAIRDARMDRALKENLASTDAYFKSAGHPTQ